MAKCFLSSAVWCYENWRSLSLVRLHPRVVLVGKHPLKNNPLLAGCRDRSKQPSQELEYFQRQSLLKHMAEHSSRKVQVRLCNML